MDDTLKTLIQVAPWGFVIIALRYLDIKEKTEERHERDANAKEKAEKDRETQQFIAKTYADAINALAKSFESSAFTTTSAIKDLKETLLEQYRNMGITQDLLDMAKSLFQTKEKKES